MKFEDASVPKRLGEGSSVGPITAATSSVIAGGPRAETGLSTKRQREKGKTFLFFPISLLVSLSFQVALRNALRYFPSDLHSLLASEFATELETYGHIYMYRWLPDIDMR